MEAPGTDVGRILQWPFIIAAMTSQARFERKFVAIIRPPAIHAELKQIAMARPIVANVVWGIRSLRDRGSEKILRGVIHMEDDFEIEIVQGLDVFRNEGVRIECERAVTGIPTIRAIACAEVNCAVTRKLLLAKGPRDLQGFLRPAERSMG